MGRPVGPPLYESIFNCFGMISFQIVFLELTRISYDLFETTGPVPVAVGIYDLAGRRMRALHRGREPIGHYELRWDGRDDAGRLVAPGIYLFRAAVEVGDRDFEHLGVLHVAY